MIGEINWRDKLKRDIGLARERVHTLEEQLKWLENAITESPDSEDSEKGQLTLLASTASSSASTRSALDTDPFVIFSLIPLITR